MSDTYQSNNRYRIVFKYRSSFDEIDYTFLAPDNIHASAIILLFANEYKILHVYKYNKDKKHYNICKTLEDKYVKKQ